MKISMVGRGRFMGVFMSSCWCGINFAVSEALFRTFHFKVSGQYLIT